MTDQPMPGPGREDALAYAEQEELERAVLVGLLREAWLRALMNHGKCDESCPTVAWGTRVLDILGPDPEAWS